MRTTSIATAENRIAAMSLDDIDRVRELELKLAGMGLEKAEIATDHVLHAGLYARTICIPAGVVLTGAFIKVPTLLVFVGHATVNFGDGGDALRGHHVIAASAGRKQVFVAHEDTYLTMVFPTEAKSVSEAEEQFTNEADLLFSRQPGAINRITITGE